MCFSDHDITECVCFSCGAQAFFDKEYITSHPEDTDKITQLKDLMQEQVTHLNHNITYSK